jgi:TonB family protein
MGLGVLWAAEAQAQTAPAAQEKTAMERAQREADGPRRRILEAARLRSLSRASEVSAQAVPTAMSLTAQRTFSRGEDAEPEGATSVLPPGAPPVQLQTASFAMSGITRVAPVALAASTPSMISVPTAAQFANLPPPRLLSKVDPDLPSDQFRRGARRTELVVDMVVNADGSVSNVALPESPGHALEGPVVAAVRQWRFEPQPAARLHTVRLVISPS